MGTVTQTLLDKLIQAHSPHGQDQQLKVLFKDRLNVDSIFDITRLTNSELQSRLNEAAQENPSLKDLAAGLDTRKVLENAQSLAAQLSHLYREARTSDGKAQHKWHPPGIRAGEEQSPTFTNLFKENWDDTCKNNSIAAVDSPVAYLRALYLFALQLESSHSENSKEKARRIRLASRRPDLATLLIDHQSTFTAQSMLQIVNETLDRNIRAGLAGSVETYLSTPEALAARKFPFVLPYEFFHHQCMLGLEEKRTTLGELNYLITQHLPFSQHENYLYGSVQGSSLHEAQRMMSGIGPKRQELLLDWPTAKHLAHIENDVSASANDKQKEHWKPLYGAVLTAELSVVSTFLERTELNAEQLQDLLAQGKFAAPTDTQTGQSSTADAARFVNASVSSSHPVMMIDSRQKPARIINATMERFERLHRMIRLQRWLDMPFADLDLLICSASESQRPSTSALQISNHVLCALGVYRYLQRHYSISAAEFAALLHQISTCALGGKPSLFDQTFNPARLFDQRLVLDGRRFSPNEADPGSHSILQHLSHSLGVPMSESALLHVVKNTEKRLGPLKCDVRTLSSIYRQARIARLFGISIDELTTLANLLGGEPIAKCLVTGKTGVTVVRMSDLHHEKLKITLCLSAPKSATGNWQLLHGSTFETSATFLSDSTSGEIIIRYPSEKSAHVLDICIRLSEKIEANTVVSLAGKTLSCYGGTLDELLQLNAPQITLRKAAADDYQLHSFGNVTQTRGASEAQKLDMLDVLMQMDWITRWIKKSAFDIPGLRHLLEPANSSDQMLGALLQHFTHLQAEIRKVIVTELELAALALPVGVDWRKELAERLLDDQGLIKDFAVNASDNVEKELRAELDQLFASLTLAEDPAVNQRLKSDGQRKLTDLLMAAHDRQQHLLERFLQQTCSLAMTCAKGVVIWAQSSIYQILRQALITQDRDSLAAILEPTIRHAQAIVQLQMSNRALQVFLSRPDWLQRDNRALTLNLATLYLLDRFNHCIVSRQHEEESLLNYLELANTASSSTGTVNLHLARIMGWTATQVSLLTAKLPDSRAKTIEDIDWIMRCHDTCAATGLEVTALLNATGLRNDSPESHWKAVGEAVMATAK